MAVTEEALDWVDVMYESLVAVEPAGELVAEPGAAAPVPV